MADNTHIEWTDATWNPLTGCEVLSAGCKNCYAMKLAGGRLKEHPSRAGLTMETNRGPVWNGKIRLNEEWLEQPVQWSRPRLIFVCAHSDLFFEGVPDAWIDRVFDVILRSPQHTFQILTKRALRMREYFGRFKPNAAGFITRGGVDVDDREPGSPVFHADQWPLPNVWLGVSVETQETAHERIGHLLHTPAAVRWISAEPLLGPLNLRKIAVTARAIASVLKPNGDVPIADGTPLPGLDWVVVGGESGTGSRPMHPEWATSLRDQCAEAGVAFVFKQWGDFYPAADGTGTVLLTREGLQSPASVRELQGREGTVLLARVGKKVAGRLLDGVLHDEYPANATAHTRPQAA